MEISLAEGAYACLGDARRLDAERGERVENDDRRDRTGLCKSPWADSGPYEDASHDARWFGGPGRMV